MVLPGEMVSQSGRIHNIMEQKLAGKAVIVTGAARRVGAAIARRLHGAGALLLLHYKNAEPYAKVLQAELNAARKDSVVLVQADLLDIAGLTEIVRNCVARFDRLDALVNNASSFFPTTMGDITEQHWDDLIGTNLKAPLFLSQAAAPHPRR